MAVVLWGRDKLSQIEFAFLMQLVICFQVCPAQISHPDLKDTLDRLPVTPREDLHTLLPSCQSVPQSA